MGRARRCDPPAGHDMPPATPWEWRVSQVTGPTTGPPPTSHLNAGRAGWRAAVAAGTRECARATARPHNKMAPSSTASTTASHAAALVAGAALGAGLLYAAQRVAARRAHPRAADSPRTPAGASPELWATPLAAAEERLTAAEEAATQAEADARGALGRRLAGKPERPAPISLAAVATAGGVGTSPWAVEGCPPPLPTPPADRGAVLRSPTAG